MHKYGDSSYCGRDVKGDRLNLTINTGVGLVC